jgi:flavin reductase (DIM6/NTAB) family NADH-FMN oxidoreductase RutF
MAFEKITPQEIGGNIFDMVGKQWMLITGGDRSGFNSMTASWGGAGILWGKPVAFCFIRPQRHTRVFADAGENFSLSFYSEQYRELLAGVFGSESGRDIDKVNKSGFTPAFSEDGAVYYEQAELVLVCRKIYYDDFKPENFLSPDIFSMYPDNDYHRMYVGEITEVLKKN